MNFGNTEISVVKSKRKTISIQIKPDQIIVRAPLKMKESDIEKFVESKRSWIEKHLKSVSEKQKKLNVAEPYTDEEIKNFTEKAKKELPDRVAFYAKKIGVTYNRITIRCQRSRWGSCSSKGNLNFNCLLILLPDEISDSVIVHELCHIKHMNHSSKFYAEVEKYYSGYKICHKWLKENGNKYISRIPK